MRAVVFDGDARTHVAISPEPEPGPGQVRIRLGGCGVCGSNLPVWEGRPWFTYPLGAGQPGHEGWGVVDGVGDGVTHVGIGQAVACLSQAAFAEYDIAAARDVVLLPPALADTPCPGEPLACAINVMRRSRVTAGATVVIVGIGFLGGLLVQLASARGARVVAVSRRPFARDIAMACGAAAAIPASDAIGTREAVCRHIGSDGAPCVIEAAGEQAALDIASGLVATRGQLVIAGYHQDGLRAVNMQHWNWHGIDVTNAHERDPRVYREGLRLAVDAAAAGTLRLDVLVTTQLPLAQLDEAFRLMQIRPDGFLKAVVCCD